MALKRNEDIEAAELDGDLLLFSPKAKKFFVMNPTAAFVWEKLAAVRDEPSLAKAICIEFGGVSEAQALDDIRRIISVMKSLDLLLDAT